MLWRFADASVTGTGHLRRDQAGQDARGCSLLDLAGASEVLVACVADGAGSAPRGEAGAQTACANFVEAITRESASDGVSPMISEECWSAFVADWLGRFQDDIGAFAEQEGRVRRDYACTFLGAVVVGDRAAFLQIGDGAIVVGAERPDEYDAFVWPQRGEYANETYFATDAAAADVVVSAIFTRRVEEIALLTDGLQSLVLDLGRREPHAPFFGRMFQVVRAAPPGHSSQLSTALAAYLASPPVRARTDDDVTLILATRRDGSSG